jgi:hypothetical protein
VDHKILQHQLDVMVRKQKKPIRPNRAEKATLALLTARLKKNINGILPAPVRYGSIGWKTMMNHYKDQLLACDFFTCETIFLRTFYVLFFIELGTRRVHLAGVATNPDGLWVAQKMAAWAT